MLKSLVENISKKSTNGKEEILDLVSEVARKNIPLMARNMNFLVIEICPLMEDNKTKLKMKTLDTLLNLSMYVNANESKRIIQS